MSKRKEFSALELSSMMRLYTVFGKSLREIANEFNTTHTRIYRALLGAGVELRPNGTYATKRFALTDKQMAAQYERRKLSLEAIAQAAGCSQNTVHCRLLRLGVKMRPTNGNSAGGS